MIPGAMIWTTFIAAVVLSFIKPLWVIYFIVVFSVYWLMRVLYFVLYVLVSWRRYRRAIKIDWFAKLKRLTNWQDKYHLIFLPTYKEDIEVLRTTFKSLRDSVYPTEKFLVVLAGEERDREHFLANAEIIKKEFSHHFFRLLITIHPDNVPGEIKGKGANAHYAGWRAKEMVDELALPYNDIIVSYFDIDTVVHRQYFANLTYLYCTHPNPTRTSFQPAVLYNNNMWDSSAAMRVAAFGTTFWLFTDLARPDRLFTFSSHSMSWRALVDVGFWEKDIVTDDSRIFLQCFVHYQGEYSVTPMYIPVSMDTVMAKNYWRGFVNLYKQQRRWGWGVEHFPYMIWYFFFEKNTIPFWKKIRYLWNLGEGMYSWAMTPILLLVLSRLPLWAASPEVKATALAQNAPVTLEWTLGLAMVGILISGVTSLFLLPPRPTHHPRHKYILMILQWLLLPVTLIIFGAVPAAEAQTRLMLGKYLGFWVTEKARRRS